MADWSDPGSETERKTKWEREGAREKRKTRME